MLKLVINWWLFGCYTRRETTSVFGKGNDLILCQITSQSIRDSYAVSIDDDECATYANRAYLASCLRQLLLSSNRYLKFGTVETNIKGVTNN